MNLLWIRSLLFKSPLRIWGTAAGIALAVALYASLAAFIGHSAARMTVRAAQAVPIDWQVQLLPAAQPAQVAANIRKAVAVTALHAVYYANTAGFVATTGGTTQTTGPGKAIAFDAGYRHAFPQEVHLLTGSLTGAVVAQQTAANLHVKPGDTITVQRVGLPPVKVRIGGVVTLPDRDALFQGVGLPKGAKPQAPPDNVLILPAAQWHALFDAQAKQRPDAAWLQYHVKVDLSRLPADPLKAYTAISGAAHNLEARVAGKALVADNLGTRLNAVRADAAYAQVLFLFLGVPGILLATALTLGVTSTHAARRRTEQALLRVRGASTRQLLALAASEALVTGVAGAVLGVAFAALFARGFIGALPQGAALALALGGALVLALILALLAIWVPAWAQARQSSVAEAGRGIGRRGAFAWERYYPDLLLLVASGLFLWQSASGGYQLVLAPEGVAATAIDYKAFIAPALFWAGSILLSLRLARLSLSRRNRLLHAALRPLGGALAPAILATLARQSRRLAVGVALLALAVAFAVSTAVFNTTYNGQARVDAQLTNGADVTVFGTGAAPAGAHLGALAALPGVQAAVPMQHRYAYVGADLQDMYGIQANRLLRATSLSDAYFPGSTAAQTLARLRATPNGVLVSQETVNNYQLALGDTLRLRLLDARTHQYHTIPFKFIGIVREFPTAPRDSFLVANAAYIAKTTHNSGAEYALIKTAAPPAQVAAEARRLLAGVAGVQVKDLGQVAHIIGSSLTALDLRGLTRLELFYALLTAAAASGLLLALGLFERRKVFATLDALGARPRQLAAFIWSEGLIVLVGGVVLGTAAGLAVAWMLVKLLTGVFDPPPQTLSLPWGYLSLLLAGVVAASVAALWLATRRMSRVPVATLREL
ncbi:ABC transporter permease [Acidihalobacter ferrooxydans]|uniref:ABC transporter permease n=1 Tax=Acidihalobacter ferrooxydans TaxID=1765967 RepID=A0A1P8UEZ6_9GAMM|nr:ABC transporter permease [Acidihalobacter ferrooxydans]APZ42401.1 ABC transporter permease [Acidihalobacter ferrooxydans]